MLIHLRSLRADSTVFSQGFFASCRYFDTGITNAMLKALAP